LVDFIRSGSPPVCIGFGSMNCGRPDELTRIVVQALKRSGQRGILLTGWGGVRAADLPDDVFMAGIIPYAWLFPQAAAVVHHGGAGTTGECLWAGIPSINVPFFADQPFWAPDRVRFPETSCRWSDWPKRLPQRSVMGTCGVVRQRWGAGYGRRTACSARSSSSPAVTTD